MEEGFSVGCKDNVDQPTLELLSLSLSPVKLVVAQALKASLTLLESDQTWYAPKSS